MALDLIARGFRIFPLIPGGKTPAIERWPDRATTDSEQIRKWWAQKDYNIGIATGPHPRIAESHGPTHSLVLIVVDYDMKPGQLGAKALLGHELLGYADTGTVQTPHGIHKYYWADASLLIPNSVSRIAPNVDVRGARGYVVGPSSVVEGVEYRWLEDVQLLPFPDAFAKLAARPNTPQHEHQKAPVGELDRPDAQARGKSYLINEAPEAIEGARGDQTTYQVAARLKDFGLSEGVTLGLMIDHWNEEKAFPPWSYDALRTKVTNAYRYGQSPPGAADPLNEFADDIAALKEAAEEPRKGGGDGGSTTPGRGRTDREPLADESFVEARKNARSVQSNALVKGLIGQGELCAIYGPPGSGKTFVAFDLAYAVATGSPFDGRKTKQGGVLYVAAEGGPAVRTRILALPIRDREDPPLRLLRYPIDFKTGDYDANRLAKLIKDREQELGIRFLMIVIDTLSETLAGGNDTEHMQAFIHNAKLVQQKTGATVIPVHHPGKDVAKGMRGHTSLVGAVDTAIEVNAPNGITASARRRMTVRKQRNMEIPDQSNWFTLSKVELGPNTSGELLSSCVVVWSDVAEDEFTDGMSETDKRTVTAIRQWGKATGNPPESIQATPFLKWLKANIPDSPMCELSAPSLRKRLERLRDEGFIGGENGYDDTE
jgi:hypothetical protein